MSDDEYDSDNLPEQTGVAQQDRAQFVVQVMVSNAEGETIHADMQNDVMATVNEKGKLTVSFPDGRQQYTRNYSGQVHSMFLDPTGTHIFVSFVSGELEYVNLAVRKHEKIAMSSSVGSQVLGAVPLFGGVAPQQLPAASFIVSAVGWDQTNTATSTTGVVVCGSREGTVYQLRIDIGDGNKPQAAVQPLITGGDFAFSEGIASVCVERFPEMKRCAVLVSSARRMLRFWGSLPTGPNASFKSLLEQRPLDSGVKPVAAEHPNNGCISIYRPTINAPPVSFAWNSPVGIDHGVFAKSADAAEPTTLAHIPFGPGLGDASGGFASVPRDVTLMAYHMILTYEDRCVVILAPAGLPWVSARPADAMRAGGSSLRAPRASAAASLQARDCRLGGADFTERQRLCFFMSRRGKGRYAVRDVARRKAYVISTGVISEIDVTHEHRSAWRIFLERAIDPSEDRLMRPRFFEAAAKITERFAKDKLPIVRWRQGMFYAEQRKFMEATTYFADCDRFEQVFEYLATNTTRGTLIDYLEKRLERVEEGLADAGDTDPRNAQVATLAVVTLQLWLERLASLDTENAVKRQDAEKRLMSFLKSRTAHVKAVNLAQFYGVFERLLAAHGRTEALIAFAESMRKFRYTVSHHVNKRDYGRACEVLVSKCNAVEHEKVWYEFAPILMQRIPCAVFDGLEGFLKKRAGSMGSFLRPELLLPAFVSYNPRDNEDDIWEEEHRGVMYLKRTLGAETLPVIWNYYVMLCIQHDTKSLDEVLRRDDAGYTTEFVLRKCIDSADQDVREKCIFLYERLGLIEEAVRIAVGAGQVDRAKELVRDGHVDADTRKQLWRQIAELVAEQESKPQAVLDVVEESGGYLLLEDVLMILAKNNTVLSEIKDAICRSLDGYSSKISKLKNDMDEATQTAREIKADESRLLNQFGYITASQRCDLCSRPLLQNMGAAPFLMYPSCAHAFHEHCLNDLFSSCSRVRLEEVGTELGLEEEELRDVAAVRDADCPSCGEFAIAQISDPYFDEFDAEEQIWSVM